MGGRSPLWTVGSRPEDAVPGDSSAVVSAFSASISALTANRSASYPKQLTSSVRLRASDEHLTDPEDVREVALDYVDQVEVLTDDGEPVGEALARDPDDTE